VAALLVLAATAMAAVTGAATSTAAPAPPPGPPSAPPPGPPSALPPGPPSALPPGALQPARAVTTTACPHWGRPALAADPKPHALRVFAIQFEQHPGMTATAAGYAHQIDCAIRTEVLPHLALNRPNVVVFDEDIGLETIAIGPRGAAARSLLTHGH
jgi:hypothetical protein